MEEEDGYNFTAIGTIRYALTVGGCVRTLA